MRAHTSDLQSRLQAALQARGPDYRPRTRHLHKDGSPKYTNRLILEDSPYLLQHAHNPVDWYAWGEEAFAAARQQNKPVFLSIGYSTCHWCHVMEEESFDNEELAALLNEHFISIKLDREQRPDIDNIYMTGVLLVTGQGGWPMSNFLTPDGRPFFAGTYFPPAQFADLLQRIHLTWQKQEDDLKAQADRISEAIRAQSAAGRSAENIGEEAVHAATQGLLANHDRTLGGFSPAPKFPQESAHWFLLGQLQRQANEDILNALHKNLRAIARGGIHDQVGGGFHRYSVDAYWLVPHFEKMLYNQAQLARVYSLGWQLTRDSEYHRVATQTIDYVLRDMCSPEGAFYSATDADSEGPEGMAEGLFFTWTPAELRETLPTGLAELAIELFQVTEGGNFEGRSILHLPQGLDEFAEQTGMASDELLEQVEAIRQHLYSIREQRKHPLRDDKILTAWNGMMITAIAEAARRLGSDTYRDAALAAAKALWQRNRQPDGRLWRVWLNGSASVDGLQEDYACLAEACIAIYDLTADSQWLQRAEDLTATMNELFLDPDQGGYFMSPAEQEVPLPSRAKDSHDGATPSGNSIALRVLVKLCYRTGENRYKALAEQALQAFADHIRRSPVSFCYMLTAADELLNGETGPLRYPAQGKVRVDIHGTREQLKVQLHIADGWHINGPRGDDGQLVATILSGEGLADVQYPESDDGLYRGEVTLEAKNSHGAEIQLQLQACNDRDGHCLAPETLSFSEQEQPGAV